MRKYKLEMITVSMAKNVSALSYPFGFGTVIPKE